MKYFDLRGKIVMQTGLPPCSSFHQLSFEINYWELAVFAIEFSASIAVAIDSVFLEGC